MTLMMVMTILTYTGFNTSRAFHACATFTTFTHFHDLLSSFFSLAFITYEFGTNGGWTTVESDFEYL